MPDDIDKVVSIRVNEKEFEKFTNKCKKMGRPHQYLIRELITAFNDDRLRIKPTEDQKNVGELYNVD